MYFNLNQTQLSIIDSVQNIMKNFDDDYWLKCDQESVFPHKFYEEIANGGWLGICMPKEFGGTALGISDESESIMIRSTSFVCISSTAMLKPSSPQEGCAIIMVSVFTPRALK